MYSLNLTKERKVLLTLIANSLSTEKEIEIDAETLKTVDFSAVLDEALAQAVHVLTFSSLKKYEEYVPKEVYEKWKTLFLKSCRKNLIVGNNQAEMVNVLSTNNLDYVILKGEASAAYYPNPELRALGDVDFYVGYDNASKTEEALISAGYIRDDMKHKSHMIFKKSPAHLEMHYNIAGVPLGKKGEIVKERIKDILIKTQKKSGLLGEFLAPSDFHHGIVILLHTQHHNLNDGLGLRHLCDWASFVNKTVNMPFWTEMVEFMREISIIKYASVLTKLCATYFDTALPDWAKDAEDELCSALLEDVFLGGNFGRKDNKRARSGLLITKNGEKKRGAIRTLAIELHRSILIRYPIVKKVWILYPFIYGYKVIKNFIQMLFGKKVSIGKMKPQAKLRQELYDKLQVFNETEDD